MTSLNELFTSSKDVVISVDPNDPGVVAVASVLLAALVRLVSGWVWNKFKAKEQELSEHGEKLVEILTSPEHKPKWELVYGGRSVTLDYTATFGFGGRDRGIISLKGEDLVPLLTKYDKKVVAKLVNELAKYVKKRDAETEQTARAEALENFVNNNNKPECDGCYADSLATDCLGEGRPATNDPLWVELASPPAPTATSYYGLQEGGCPVGAVGPQGPVGPAGPRGEQGPPGVCDCRCPSKTGEPASTFHGLKDWAEQMAAQRGMYVYPTGMQSNVNLANDKNDPVVTAYQEAVRRMTKPNGDLPRAEEYMTQVNDQVREKVKNDIFSRKEPTDGSKSQGQSVRYVPGMGFVPNVG